MIGYLTGNFTKCLAFRAKVKLFCVRKVFFFYFILHQYVFIMYYHKSRGKKCLKPKVEVENKYKKVL